MAIFFLILSKQYILLMRVMVLLLISIYLDLLKAVYNLVDLGLGVILSC